MKIKYAKALRSIAKIVLLLCFLSVLGLGIFFTYKSVKYKPYKVRVSNVTDSAFTVSWVTDEPMVGVVYYSEKDSFLPGPLAWIGKQKAEDDRDVSNAQTECVSEFNKKASKNRDDNFTVDIEGYDCNNVKVVKRGRYYTHHVTVQNLEAEKEYYFRVGDGYISYAENSGTYSEGEIEGIDIFATKTKPIFTEISAPNPAYGTTETVYQTSDGYFTFNKNYDSIVFLKVKNEDNEYGVFSSVANNDGGWSIDLSNVRDEEGLPVNLDDSILVFMPQAENHKAFVFEEFEYGKVVFPLRLPGNAEEDFQVKNVGLTTNFILKLVYKSAASHNDAGCKATGTYGRLEYCGNQCYRKWTRGSELCGWQKVSSGCPSKPCTCPGENCNPPAPEPPAPSAATCPIYDSPIIGDFTTVCHQPSCTCTNSLARATSVTCGNKCEKKATPCTSGLGSLADFSSICTYTNCRCTHPDSDGKNALCGDSCKRKAAVCSENWGTWRVVNNDKECKNFPAECSRSECTKLCYTETMCKFLITPPASPPPGVGNLDDYDTPCPKATCTCSVPSQSQTVRYSEKCKEEKKSAKCYGWRESAGGYECKVIMSLSAEDACGTIGGTFDDKCGDIIKKEFTCAGEGKLTNFSSLCTNRICDCPKGSKYGNVACGDSCEELICYKKERSPEGKVKCSRIQHSNPMYESTCSYLGGVTNSSCNGLIDPPNPSEEVCAVYSERLRICFSGKNLLQCATLKSAGTYYSIFNYSNPLGKCQEENNVQGVELDANNGNIGFRKISPFKTYAQNSNNNEGNYLYLVPESGAYLFKLLRGQEEKIVSDGKTSYYFYYNRNGEEGYQEPEDLLNVKAEEDLLVEAEIAVISISKIAAAKEIKLSQGINIVSFDFMPNSIDDPFTSSEFLKLANKNGDKVSHISYFSGGQWDGGTSYDFEAKETKGVSFDLGFGKGYIIVAEEDTTVTIPGYNVQSAVPIAFSSGWNLVGVHGYDTQYTANSLINSINTIQGLKSNNVTYWPTSKGMYQGYQLSEGQAYGQDYPISKDLGYFVRINEFNAPNDTCKSIIWNPGGDLNGKCGSSN